MATTNNLGRVQGISLWVADGVVTTTGTITLTNSTMHPLINDNVVDTNGNVFKITAVSGTNQYTITTSGTPIYRITSDYTLPIASATQLGGVKKGNGVNIDSNGVISIEQSGIYEYFGSYTGVVKFYTSPQEITDTSLNTLLRNVYNEIVNKQTKFMACISYPFYSNNIDSFTTSNCSINKSGSSFLFYIISGTGTSNEPIFESFIKNSSESNFEIQADTTTILNVTINLVIYKIKASTPSTINVYDSFIRLESEEEIYQTNDFDNMLDNLINKPSKTIIYINNIGYAYFETSDNNLYNNSVEIINEEEQTKTTYTCTLNKADKTIKITSNVEPYIKEENKQ